MAQPRASVLPANGIKLLPAAPRGSVAKADHFICCLCSIMTKHSSIRTKNPACLPSVSSELVTGDKVRGIWFPVILHLDNLDPLYTEQPNSLKTQCPGPMAHIKWELLSRISRFLALPPRKILKECFDSLDQNGCLILNLCKKIIMHSTGSTKINFKSALTDILGICIW